MNLPLCLSLFLGFDSLQDPNQHMFNTSDLTCFGGMSTHHEASYSSSSFTWFSKCIISTWTNSPEPSHGSNMVSLISSQPDISTSFSQPVFLNLNNSSHPGWGLLLCSTPAFKSRMRSLKSSATCAFTNFFPTYQHLMWSWCIPNLFSINPCTNLKLSPNYQTLNQNRSFCYFSVPTSLILPRDNPNL